MNRVTILSHTALKEATQMIRTQFPLVAWYALTVDKAQGLIMKEGVVVLLRGGVRFRPASKHGLPFVAFTRSESFAMNAFKDIPPWQDFAKGRELGVLSMQLAFTEWLDEMHVKTRAHHSLLKTRKDKDKVHEQWRLSRIDRRRRDLSCLAHVVVHSVVVTIWLEWQPHAPGFVPTAYQLDGQLALFA